MDPLERAHWFDAIYHLLVVGDVDTSATDFYRNWFDDLLAHVRGGAA